MKAVQISIPKYLERDTGRTKVYNLSDNQAVVTIVNIFTNFYMQFIYYIN